jgi:hypothetical protein
MGKTSPGCSQPYCAPPKNAIATGQDRRRWPFALAAGAARNQEAVLYLVVQGGEAAAGKRGDDPALALLAVLRYSPNQR